MLNHNTAGADILWLRALLYRSNRAAIRQPPRTITAYADSIIGLDPYFYAIYGWHHVFRYRAVPTATMEDLHETNRILITGLQYFPQDWTLAQTIALNHIGHRHHRSRKNRIEDLEEAAYFATMGAQMNGAPPVMTGLSISIRNRLARVRKGLPEWGEHPDGTIEASPEEIDLLLQRYVAAQDSRERLTLLNQLAYLGVSREVMELTSELENRFHRTHLERYGYLHPDLFTLVDVDLYRWGDGDGQALSIELDTTGVSSDEQ